MNTTSMIFGFMEVILFLGLLALSAFIYFIPAIWARDRRHRNFAAIFMLNLCLGWTFIGWVISMVWACTDSTESEN